MKKIFITALAAALIFASLGSCAKQSQTKDSTQAADTAAVPTDLDIPAETTSGQEDEYVWELIDSQVIAPDGTPVEEIPEYQKISENALVQSLEDITDLDTIVAGYETCYNYDFTYDETIIYQGEYYLVTDTSSIEAYKTECAKYFEEGRFPPCLIEREGNYYYNPVDHDITLTIDMGEDGTGLNYSDENICELSFIDTLGRHHTIELTKGDSGFLISYTTVE